MLFEKKNQPLGILSSFRIVYMQIPVWNKNYLSVEHPEASRQK